MRRTAALPLALLATPAAGAQPDMGALDRCATMIVDGAEETGVAACLDPLAAARLADAFDGDADHRQALEAEAAAWTARLAAHQREIAAQDDPALARRCADARGRLARRTREACARLDDRPETRLQRLHAGLMRPVLALRVEWLGKLRDRETDDGG